MTNINKLTEIAKSTLWYIVACIIWAIFLTFTLNALMDEADMREQMRSQYVSELERVVAKCTSSGDNAIQIGDELYFCGASSSGVKM